MITVSEIFAGSYFLERLSLLKRGSSIWWAWVYVSYSLLLVATFIMLSASMWAGMIVGSFLYLAFWLKVRADFNSFALRFRRTYGAEGDKYLQKERDSYQTAASLCWLMIAVLMVCSALSAVQHVIWLVEGLVLALIFFMTLSI